jgi:hypothetical protein
MKDTHLHKNKPTDSKLKNALFSIKRGLAGYISYLAACEMNKTFSEYILYEPILRILMSKKYVVECEYECPNNRSNRGDKKRVDFYFKNNTTSTVIEVKWAKRKKLIVKKDVDKFEMFESGANIFLCVFGRKSIISKIVLTPKQFNEVGKPIYADFTITRFGCRIFKFNHRRNKICL